MKPRSRRPPKLISLHLQKHQKRPKEEWSKKVSPDNETEIQKTPQTNQSPPAKASEKAKRRVVSKKARGRQPKKDWLKQRNLAETVKMSSYRGRPSAEERKAGQAVNIRRLSSAEARTADIELPESKNGDDSHGGN